MPYKEGVRKLFELQKFGMKFGLDNMRDILRKLGNPQEGLKLVHVAGTNGKGSVAVTLTSILTAAGHKTGLYTSPHLITFRERIRVGDECLSEGDVLRLIGQVEAVTDPASPPTFFEFVTAMAFLYFKERGVDLAVIEAGLGGRLDSTNVITPLVSVITNIALEHTQQLGDTLAKIGFEKAGIIKPGVPVVTGDVAPEAAAVIAAAARERHSPLWRLGREFTATTVAMDDRGRPTFDFRRGETAYGALAVALCGPHQADNAALAVATLPILAGKGFPVTEAQLRAGLARVRWPGRAEFMEPGQWPPEGPKAVAPLLMDGAHNPAGAASLAKTLAHVKRRRLLLVVGVMADKDIAGVLAPVLPLAQRLYLTRPLFQRAADPELLLEKIRGAFGEPPMPFSLHHELPEAIKAAAAEAQAGDLVVLSGSLFTVGEGRAYLLEAGDVESN